MPKSRTRLRSSRRVPPLNDSEIDHEINLVDKSIHTESSPSVSAGTDSNPDLSMSVSNQPLIPTKQTEDEDVRVRSNTESVAGPSGEPEGASAPAKGGSDPVVVEESDSTKVGLTKSGSTNKQLSQHGPHPPKEPETAIDILYENQRGGFLCGIPLFSSAALGNLDPPAWTNFAHKSSPTDISTAQVPDPSWEWAWPEWRVNHDESIETDSEGWEYSFMFAKAFSWHGPKWYNSYVRRRTWIRRRVKKGIGYEAYDPHQMNPDYFPTASTQTHHHKTAMTADEVERASNGQPSPITREFTRDSRDVKGDGQEDTELQKDVRTAGDLMTLLRRTRIDREKLEAIENYIRHCSDDLLQLSEYMHEIMSTFIFQASRKLLLTRLTKFHEEELEKQPKEKSPAINRKAENLAEAIKHADEEVRRLEYWSDIKDMAENGETAGAVDCNKGWDSSWEGVDNSGAKGVKEGDELP
ncbi:hypothetical protein F5B20DRAFT_137483 [Whalleya microplaca]|nr:hypothetical protein F5B20DRAFT_137483 [Whalleya microplaca]